MADPLVQFGSLEAVERPNDKVGGIAATNDATAKNPVGSLYRVNGKTYRYVKHSPSSAVASVAGGPCYWRALDQAAGTYTVSSVEADTIAGINGVAGCYLGVVTSGYFTWIQVGGVILAKTTAGTAAGDKCIGKASNLIFDVKAAGTAPTDVVFGIAIGARDDTTGLNQNVLLQNLDW